MDDFYLSNPQNSIDFLKSKKNRHSESEPTTPLPGVSLPPYPSLGVPFPLPLGLPPKGPLQDLSTASVPQANGVSAVSGIRAWTSEPALPNQNIVQPPQLH